MNLSFWTTLKITGSIGSCFAFRRLLFTDTPKYLKLNPPMICETYATGSLSWEIDMCIVRKELKRTMQEPCQLWGRKLEPEYRLLADPRYLPYPRSCWYGYPRWLCWLYPLFSNSIRHSTPIVCMTRLFGVRNMRDTLWTVRWWGFHPWIF